MARVDASVRPEGWRPAGLAHREEGRRARGRPRSNRCPAWRRTRSSRVSGAG